MADLLQQNKRSLAGWPMVIGWLAMLLFAFHTSSHMVGAGDTWVALACGRHFINHGVSTVEPFSANSHKAGPTPEEVKTWPKWAQTITEKVGIDTVKFWHPTGWVNQNWLTHVIFYWLAYDSPIADAKTLSFNALVYWKFTIYILSVICIYYTGRVLGAHPALSAASACAAMFIGRSFIDIRPAGFSNLLVAVFMLILVLSTYRNYRYIWLIVPLTVFWANLHGGYIYIFITLVPVVVLRLLTTLSKKWTVSVYSILTWLALYVLIVKDTNHDPFTPLSPFQDKFIILLVLFIVVSFVLANMRQVTAPAFYAYHIVVSLIVFFSLLTYLFPEKLPQLHPQAGAYVDDCRQSFFLAFVAAVGLGIIVTLLKDRLVSLPLAAVWHTVFAGLAAFLGSIIFNPFHLTNLTHTFQISISQNAEGWRNVHEWWPAFRWDNPVGSAFPFMMMIIAGIGVMALYLFSRQMFPKLLKGPKTELESQQKRFRILYRVFGFAAAVLICWMVMLSFSLVEASFTGFLLCGLLAGILWAAVFISVHSIYVIIPFSLFAVWTADASQGYNGRYIFAFVTIPAYAAMFAVGSQLSSKPKYSIVNILYVLAAAVASLILVVVLVNPFGFKESILHVGQFWGLSRIWQPAYEANLEITYANLFPVIYIINGVCVLSWLFTEFVRAALPMGAAKEPTEESPVGKGLLYQLGRIDLALITISALTVYMAYRSRRFIPISGYVTCPIIALLTDQVIQTIASSWNFYRNGELIVPRMPRSVRRFLIFSSAVVVVSLGTFWGLKFKRTYLAPWPFDPDLRSMFIRMTASHMKPFAACRFITENKISGNMMNYWTEGGFVAWGQEPDPNSGKTPLQLFMDGRAQAAYNYDAYNLWSGIAFGGETVQRARMRNQRLTAEDYVEIGEWINSQLKKYNVWVVLMPVGQFDEPFVQALQYNASWRLVYFDDKQKLFVDISTPRGKEIFNGLESGATKYPSEATRNIMISHDALLYSQSGEVLTIGVECAIKAYEENPARVPIQIIQAYYERVPQLRPRIDVFWKKYLDDFLANEKSYLHQDNYYNRITGALMAMTYLQPIAQGENNNDTLQLYREKRAELSPILEKTTNMRW